MVLMHQILAIGYLRQAFGQLLAILQAVGLGALGHDLDAMRRTRTEGQGLRVGETLATGCHVGLRRLRFHGIAKLFLHNENLGTGRWQRHWQWLWYNQTQHVV